MIGYHLLYLTIESAMPHPSHRARSTSLRSHASSCGAIRRLLPARSDRDRRKTIPYRTYHELRTLTTAPADETTSSFRTACCPCRRALREAARTSCYVTKETAQGNTTGYRKPSGRNSAANSSAGLQTIRNPPPGGGRRSSGRAQQSPWTQRAAPLESPWRSNEQNVRATAREAQPCPQGRHMPPRPRQRRTRCPQSLAETAPAPSKSMNWQDLVVQQAIVQIIRPLIDPRLGQLSLGGGGVDQGGQRMEAIAFAKVIADGGEDRRSRHRRRPAARLHLGPAPAADRTGLTHPWHQPSHPDDRNRSSRANGRAGQGIAQGAPLSTIFLGRVYLDAQLDRRGRNQTGNPPLIRWVDDLLILCRTRKEAEAAYQRLQAILQPTGMRLKGQLKRDSVEPHQERGTGMVGSRNGPGKRRAGISHAGRRFSTARLACKLEEAMEGS